MNANIALKETRIYVTDMSNILMAKEGQHMIETCIFSKASVKTLTNITATTFRCDIDLNIGNAAIVK